MGSSNATWSRERFWLLATTVVLLLSFTAFLVFMTRPRAAPARMLDRAWHQQRHKACLSDSLWSPSQRTQLPGLCEEDGRKWCAASGLEPTCFASP